MLDSVKFVFVILIMTSNYATFHCAMAVCLDVAMTSAAINDDVTRDVMSCGSSLIAASLYISSIIHPPRPPPSTGTAYAIGVNVRSL